jgi:hypothetical protein
MKATHLLQRGLSDDGHPACLFPFLTTRAELLDRLTCSLAGAWRRRSSLGMLRRALTKTLEESATYSKSWPSC